MMLPQQLVQPLLKHRFNGTFHPIHCHSSHRTRLSICAFISTTKNDDIPSIGGTTGSNSHIVSEVPLVPLTNAFQGYYDWLDPFQLYNTCFTSEERAVQESVRQLAQTELISQIIPLHRNEATNDESRQLMQLFGSHGLFGVTLPEIYTNNPTLGYVSYGLITTELERIDSSYRSAVSVQSSLVMYPIVAYAQSDTIRQKYVPDLASGQYIGCFGLTESNQIGRASCRERV